MYGPPGDPYISRTTVLDNTEYSYVPTQLVLNKHYADVKLFTYKSIMKYSYICNIYIIIVTVINCMPVTILKMMKKQLH